jgi:hypothetical protein
LGVRLYEPAPTGLLRITGMCCTLLSGFEFFLFFVCLFCFPNSALLWDVCVCSEGMQRAETEHSKVECVCGGTSRRFGATEQSEDERWSGAGLQPPIHFVCDVKCDAVT